MTRSSFLRTAVRLATQGASALVAFAVLGGWRRRPQTPVPCAVLTPQQTEGPFFVDEHLNRSDIRVDPSNGAVSSGAPLRLTLRLFSSTAGCAPLAGALVDVWQCDAEGAYSDVNNLGGGARTVGRKFLRGSQTTDAAGRVMFMTIYPGWYEGRAVHIHFKVRTASAGGGRREVTSQLYFDDALTDRVHAKAPYAARGRRRMRNTDDGIYRQGGRQLTLEVAESPDGYAAPFDIILRG